MEKQPVVNVTNAAGIAIQQVLYTGKVHITGGRDGAAKSDDGRLDILLSAPGGQAPGTNPEQLLAAGWSACFIGAVKHNAARMKIRVPADTAVDAEVDLASGEEGFTLQARLTVNLPGLEPEQARSLVLAAHDTCPYSKATRGNINVQIDIAI